MLKRPAIALVTPSFLPRPGGLAVAASRVAGALADKGWEIHVITPMPVDAASGIRTEVEERDGIFVHRFHIDLSRQSLLPAWADVLAETDRAVSFRLFHAFYLSALYPCVRVARQGNPFPYRPVLASIRGSDAEFLNDSSIWPLIRYCLRQSDWLTSVNREYLDAFRQHVPLEDRSSVIYNGVESASFRWRPADANRGIVGTLGEFRRVKNIPLLVRAFAALAEDQQRGLRLGGYFLDARDEAWVTTLAGELRVSEQVHITGHLSHDRIDDFLQGIYVYVQASSAEGLPNAVLEAAAAGVPIVATSVGGMREVFTDDLNALLVPAGDLPRMAYALQRLLSDPELARRIGAGAYALSLGLSTAREAQQWDDLYSMLLRKASASLPPYSLATAHS
jgi:glycosyltransferase involved in cell wall biosynthesis